MLIQGGGRKGAEFNGSKCTYKSSNFIY